MTVTDLQIQTNNPQFTQDQIFGNEDEIQCMTKVMYGELDEVIPRNTVFFMIHLLAS